MSGDKQTTEHYYSFEAGVETGWNAAIDAAEANLSSDPDLEKALWIIRAMRKVS